MNLEQPGPIVTVKMVCEIQGHTFGRGVEIDLSDMPASMRRVQLALEGLAMTLAQMKSAEATQ